MKIPDGFTQLFPYLTVTDATSCIQFLVIGLGGVELGRTMADGRIANARVRFGDTTIMVSEASTDAPPGVTGLYLYAGGRAGPRRKYMVAVATADRSAL
jgi:uncharacterized glyoxalase superfamily protein PhnB